MTKSVQSHADHGKQGPGFPPSIAEWEVRVPTVKAKCYTARSPFWSNAANVGAQMDPHYILCHCTTATTRANQKRFFSSIVLISSDLVLPVSVDGLLHDSRDRKLSLRSRASHEASPCTHDPQLGGQLRVVPPNGGISSQADKQSTDDSLPLR